jgi:hypothetical protein
VSGARRAAASLRAHDGTVAPWLLDGQLQPKIIERFERRASAVAITARGDRILAACGSQAHSPGRGLSLIDVATGEVHRSGIDDFIIELAIGEDAEIAVGTSYDGANVAWIRLVSFHWLVSTAMRLFASIVSVQVIVKSLPLTSTGQFTTFSKSART